MDTLNIKDYLQMNVKETNTKKSSVPEYTFALIFDNGSDFIIERTSTTNIVRQLCWIANENLLFIRNPKDNKDTPVTSEVIIKNFFKNESITRKLEFKNNFFNIREDYYSFSYLLYCLHTEKFNIRRNFVKFGYNPEEYISSNRYASNKDYIALDSIDFNKVLKVVRLLQDYKQVLKRKDKDLSYGVRYAINAEFVLLLCRIYEKFNFDFVKTFLSVYSDSDSLVDLSYSDRVIGEKTFYIFETFEGLIEKYNLNFTRFCTYLFRDLYSQGIDEIDDHLLNNYKDYLDLQIKIFDKVKDKYPEHFKEAHDKAILIFNLNQKYFQEQKIERLNAHNKDLEYQDTIYSIIVAKTSQDLIEEGINLHHCVGSYVNRVKNGECSIFFLRKTDEMDKSLITIEVRDDNVVQVRGLCERLMDDNEREFLTKWCKIKQLKFISE